MKTKDIERSVFWAKMFIERANIMLKKQDDNTDEDHKCDVRKESGSVRRASMELTRSLAVMRAGR